MSSDPSVRDSSPDFATLQNKSRSKMLILGALGLLIVGGGIAYANHASSVATQTELSASAGALGTCVFGGPLEKGETALLRVRRLQLEAMGLSDAEVELKRAEVWPLACSDEAKKMKDVLSAHNIEDGKELLGSVIQWVGQTDSRHTDPTAIAEPLHAFVQKLVPEPLAKVPKPLPAVVLNVDALRSVAPVSKYGTALSRTYTEANPGLALPVLVTEESLEAPLLCLFPESGPASCRLETGLGKVKGQGIRLLGTSDAASKTLLFAGRRGSEGVFVSEETDPVTKLYSYGGLAGADGSAAVLGWDIEEKVMKLVERSTSGQITSTTLSPNFRIGNYFYNAGLLWDQVLVRGVTPDNEIRLFSLPLGNKAGDFSLVDIGELDEPGLIRSGEEEQTHITGCRTKAATVVRVRGRDNDFVTFRIGEKFSMPVYGPTWGTLGCHGTTATFVTPGFATSGTKIYYASCTSAGCELRQYENKVLDRESLALRPTEERHVQAVDLAGQVLVVWKAGERGGLRMRIAKPDLFEKAPDSVLFDDMVAEGKLSDMSSILGFRLYSRENYGLLLLSTIAGLHAFRISTSGDVQPVEVGK